MELEVTEDVENNLEQEQGNWLTTTLESAISSGIDIGIRALLPDYLEDYVIEIKDNLMEYGIKEGISKTVEDTIDTGKGILGIFTGNFENANQVNEIIKKGGLLDNVSDLLDDVLDKIEDAKDVNSTVMDIIKGGKDTILYNVELKLETTLSDFTDEEIELSNNLNA